MRSLNPGQHRASVTGAAIAAVAGLAWLVTSFASRRGGDAFDTFVWAPTALLICVAGGAMFGIVVATIADVWGVGPVVAALAAFGAASPIYSAWRSGSEIGIDTTLEALAWASAFALFSGLVIWAAGIRRRAGTSPSR